MVVAAVFLVMGHAGVALADGGLAQEHIAGCATTREDVIGLVGYFNDDVWGPHFHASPSLMAQVKAWIYATGDRESGNNQCRSDGSYVLGDRYLTGLGYHSVSFVQLHDGYDDYGHYIGSAWWVWDNPYRGLGLAGRYDPAVAAGFITWYAYRYGNLNPWCTTPASGKPSYMCKRGSYP